MNDLQVDADQLRALVPEGSEWSRKRGGGDPEFRVRVLFHYPDTNRVEVKYLTGPLTGSRNDLALHDIINSFERV
jgi:predicted ABC-class ATPase